MLTKSKPSSPSERFNWLRSSVWMLFWLWNGTIQSSLKPLLLCSLCFKYFISNSVFPIHHHLSYFNYPSHPGLLSFLSSLTKSCIRPPPTESHTAAGIVLVSVKYDQSPTTGSIRPSSSKFHTAAGIVYQCLMTDSIRQPRVTYLSDIP